jgi:hypothetical protein
MEKWLLISHCQTFGLTNSLNLLAPGIEVEPMGIWGYRDNIAAVSQNLSSYDRVLVLPDVLQTPGADFSNAHRVDQIPGVLFRAYHPDLCYASGGNQSLAGPADSYHSMIAIAAFNRGLTVDDTLSLFNARSYEACGYMDLWQSERDALVTSFRSIGIDLSSELRRWAAGSAFMYSINHIRIACLYDIAKAYLTGDGIEVLDSDVLPPDNLAQGACFPVYPEIGEHLGVEGSYTFKKLDSYRRFTLSDFISRSFDLYAGFGVGNVVPDHTVSHRYAALEALF